MSEKWKIEQHLHGRYVKEKEKWKERRKRRNKGRKEIFPCIEEKSVLPGENRVIADRLLTYSRKEE